MDILCIACLVRECTISSLAMQPPDISQRDESAPMIKSAIHLLALLFTSVLDMPEFHRKVVTPTVQKFSIALLQLSEKAESPEAVKVGIPYPCFHCKSPKTNH